MARGCLQCNFPLTFERKREESLKKFCGHSCSLKWIRAHTARVFKFRNCVHCGEAYTPTSSSQKYCKHCVPTKNQRILLNYGLTGSAYKDLVLSTGGVCPICLTNTPQYVDHDHATGRVRGFLCFKCNVGLGNFSDDPKTLRRAASYLEKGKKNADTEASLLDADAEGTESVD
jgi:hypothetical protein